MENIASFLDLVDKTDWSSTKWNEYKSNFQLRLTQARDYPYQNCQPNVCLSSLMPLRISGSVISYYKKSSFCPEVQVIFYAKYEKYV